MQIMQTPRRNLDGNHVATITRIEERPKQRARISFELKTTPPTTVSRDYPLSLHPRSALYELLVGLDILQRGEYKAIDLADLVGVKAQIHVARKIVATKNTVVSATRLRTRCA